MSWISFALGFTTGVSILLSVYLIILWNVEED